MKRFLTLLAFVAVAICSHAYDKLVNGIYYNLNTTNKTASVTYSTLDTHGYSNSRDWTYNLNNTNYTGSVVIPEKIIVNNVEYVVTTISSSAFRSCSGLKSISIPKTVTRIYSTSFYNCKGLNAVNISDMEAWCSVSFSQDSGYTNPSNPLYYAHNLYLDNELVTDLVIPNSITTIKGEAFYGCTCLSSVTIPNSVTTIGANAFNGCSSITSISIGNSVTSIGLDAFSGCSNVEDVYCYSEKVPSGGISFPSIGKATLYIPLEYYDSYKKSSTGKNFGKIVGMTSYINIVDGDTYENDIYKKSDELIYTRTFSEKLAGKWSALYVPISINVEDYIGEFDIAEIYAVCPNADTNGDGEINAYDENRLIINKKTTGVTRPNTPYVIRPKEAKTYTIASADNILYPTETNSLFVATSTDIYTFTGLNTTTEAVGNTQYYMTVNGVLDYSPTSPISIKPNRWLMSIESHGYGSSPSTVSMAKPISISVLGEDEETTGIEAIGTTRNNESIYNLNGVKMNEGSLPAGIYVKNGKKFVVK